MREDLSAVLLAGAMEVAFVPARVFQRAVPAIRRFVRATRAPLALDAEVFHYRIRLDRSITAVRRRRGARICFESHSPEGAEGG